MRCSNLVALSTAIFILAPGLPAFADCDAAGGGCYSATESAPDVAQDAEASVEAAQAIDSATGATVNETVTNGWDGKTTMGDCAGGQPQVVLLNNGDFYVNSDGPDSNDPKMGASVKICVSITTGAQLAKVMFFAPQITPWVIEGEFHAGTSYPMICQYVQTLVHTNQYPTCQGPACSPQTLLFYYAYISPVCPNSMYGISNLFKETPTSSAQSLRLH